MEKSRLPTQSSVQAPGYEEAKRLLDGNLVLEQDLADTVARTLSGFEEEYARLINAANKNSK